MPFHLKNKRVWIAGHRGMVGMALQRRLSAENCELVLIDRAHLDLRRQCDVEAWMEKARPQAIFVAAATVGGIHANNSYPGEFLYDNLIIAANIMEAARKFDVEKLLYLGSSCIYPKFAQQPIPEEAMLTGALEPTNEWYAVAKISGIMMCRAYRRQYGSNFISAMPTNLYGPFDTFDLERSHVLPALLLKAHRAKTEKLENLTIWGSGKPRREFLHVDDCADALVFLMKTYDAESHINVGSGSDLTIGELAQLVSDTIGYRGQIVCDATRPDGTPQKLMNSEKLNRLGWTPKIALRDGIQSTYRWFLDEYGRDKV